MEKNAEHDNPNVHLTSSLIEFVDDLHIQFPGFEHGSQSRRYSDGELHQPHSGIKSPLCTVEDFSTSFPRNIALSSSEEALKSKIQYRTRPQVTTRTATECLAR